MRQVCMMQEGELIGVWVNGNSPKFFSATTERAKAESYATRLAERECKKAERLSSVTRQAHLIKELRKCLNSFLM